MEGATGKNSSAPSCAIAVPAKLRHRSRCAAASRLKLRKSNPAGKKRPSELRKSLEASGVSGAQKFPV